jgi:hypothetical protein
MAGLKPDTSKIKTVEDANPALRETGMPRHGLAAIDAEADRQMAEINNLALEGGACCFPAVVRLRVSCMKPFASNQGGNRKAGGGPTEAAVNPLGGFTS